jgi:signal transduction histidine kinase
LRPVGRRSGLLALNLILVSLISLLDWLTSAGVVVGILLVLPILASAASDRERDVWVTFVAASIGFLAAAVGGAGPVSPESVWVPNRILAGLSIPGSLALALFLQSLRRRAEVALSQTERASDLNRLMLSLLAHDLRAPLGMAIQAFDLIAADSVDESFEHSSLVADLKTRLRRSLRAIDSILSVARGSQDGLEPVTVTGAQIMDEIQREVAAFDGEAKARGKTLSVDLEGDRGRAFAIDLLVPRQAVSILVDNAIRHSFPGEIGVQVKVAAGQLEVRVRDAGPPLTIDARPGDRSKGLGLGLALCRTLAHRANGNIEVESQEGEGKALVLRLPLAAARGSPSRLPAWTSR